MVKPFLSLISCFASRVSDLSLEEDDVLKLALLGNNAKTKDTIDTLVKSLVIRNRFVT